MKTVIPIINHGIGRG